MYFYKIPYITTLSSDNLLIFYGIGTTLLVLAIQFKITIMVKKKHNSEIKLARYRGLYKFIKTVFNWGIFYFLSAVFIFISSLFPKADVFWRPIFFNMSFVFASFATLFITLAYFVLVVKDLIYSMITAAMYEL